MEHACMAGSRAIYSAIQQFGKDQFEAIALMEVDDTLLEEFEAKMIAEHNTTVPYGYNLTSGGNKGCVMNPDSVQSRIRSGPEHHWYNNNGWTGRNHEDESKVKIGTSVSAAFTDERKEMLANKNAQRKVHDLPRYVSHKTDRGKVTGYQVQSKKGLFPFKCFCDSRLSMEEKRVLAIAYRDEQLHKLNIEVE